MTYYLAVGNQYLYQHLALSIDRTLMYENSNFYDKYGAPQVNRMDDFHTMWMTKQFAYFNALDGGHRNPLLLTGSTLSSVGAAIAGANVIAFTTSDNAFVERSVSDANGTYTIPSPFNVAHRVVAEASQSLAGVSLNTVVPV